MSQAELVAAQVARNACNRVTRKTIAALQKLTECKLSGDDSELANAWDEICVQLQTEESWACEAYDDTVRAFVAKFLDELPPYERLAIWLQTDDGWDWEADKHEPSESPALDMATLVEYVTAEYIYAEAGRWSNRRIRAFLDREC
jgi:hypothetical protein